MTKRQPWTPAELSQHARETICATVTAALDGAARDDPSAALSTLRAASAEVPIRQLGEYVERWELVCGEILSGLLLVIVGLTGAEPSGPVETAQAAMEAWSVLAPVLSADVDVDLPGVDPEAGDAEVPDPAALVEALEHWLHQQQRPEDGSCPD